MSTEIIKQEETNGEKAAVLSFLLISAAFLMAEIGLMDISLLKAPELIQWIYDGNHGSCDVEGSGEVAGKLFRHIP